MGCVQAKPPLNSPHHGVRKLKLANGYPKKGNRQRPISQRQPKKDSGKLLEQQNESEVLVVANESIGEAEGEGGRGGNVSNRIVEKIGEDDLVDGWPKWLVDNISRDVLTGLVPKSADSYDKLSKVGQGTYSNVYKAKDKDTGKIVALKKVRFDTSEPESVKFMAREIMMLRKLDHPNVIKLQGIATSRMQYSLYLVFDYMESDLTKIISRSGERLTETQVKCYMQQLLSGLHHCHGREILHRDIKGSNLLIDNKGVLKIADFGLANSFLPKPKRPLTNRVVTLWYRAPELLLGSTDYGVGIDLWSAGCLLAEMFVGRPIMPGRTEVEQLDRIFKLCGSPPDDYWKKLNLRTSFRPSNREPSFEEAFRGFPKSSFGLLTKLLALDPTYRGSAASALQSDFFSSSPLPCDPSALPTIRTKEKKKRTTSKLKQSSQQICETHQQKESITKLARGKNGHSDALDMNKDMIKHVHDLSTNSSHRREMSSKHSQEYSLDTSTTYSQEMWNSASSSSSSIKPYRPHESWHASLSPFLRLQQGRSAKTEGHPIALKNINPNALKSIKSFTLLHASITDIVNPREGNALAPHHRSLSTLDFRNLDPEMISKIIGLDKESD